MITSNLHSNTKDIIYHLSCTLSKDSSLPNNNKLKKTHRLTVAKDFGRWSLVVSQRAVLFMPA